MDAQRLLYAIDEISTWVGKLAAWLIIALMTVVLTVSVVLFGVLRKELSLLMIYQALGTQDIQPLLDWVQIFTFLVFLTFYLPCLSTLADQLAANWPVRRWRL